MRDLEARIRDALRADEIGWDDLRQPTPRVPSRPPRRWPTVLAIAAAVAVVASVAAAIAVTGGGGSNGAAGGPAYAGYVWQMTGLTDRRGPVPDPASVPAHIAFSDTAVIGSLDGASIFGHYEPTSQGYALSDLGVAGDATEPATTGSDQMRIGSAFASVFIRRTGQTLDLTNPAIVAARVNGDQLVLQANGVTMRLSRVGPSQLSPIIDAVGYSWRVETLTDQHGKLTMPPQVDATIAFSRYGYMLAKDTVNTLESLYDPIGDGYVITRFHGATAGGSVGNVPNARLVAAVDAMVARKATVTATVDGDTLTLRRNDVTLTLHRGAALHNDAVGSDSGSGSAAPVPATSASAAVPPTQPNSVSTSPVTSGRGASGSHH